jgi:hypothetical protein
LVTDRLGERAIDCHQIVYADLFRDQRFVSQPPIKPRKELGKAGHFFECTAIEQPSCFAHVAMLKISGPRRSLPPLWSTHRIRTEHALFALSATVRNPSMN